MEPREFVEHELKVISTLFQIQKELYPMVVLIKNDERFKIPVSYNNDAHKDIVSQGIKDLVKKSEPDIVIYMAEAWVKFIRAKWDRLPWTAQGAEKHEIVIVQIEFKSGERFTCEAKIIRDPKNPDRQVYLDKFEYGQDDMSMGRFVDFFPAKRLN